MNAPARDSELAGAKIGLVADLLAECLELADAYSICVRAAIRRGDLSAALESYRGFDCAVRTARRCADELRALAGGNAR
jgi:hypothetical protein